MERMSTLYHPATGEAFATVPSASPADVAVTLQGAREAYERWRSVAASDKARLLHAVSARLDELVEEFASIESRNTGKPIRETRLEAGRAVSIFSYWAGWADKIHGMTIPVAGPYHAYTRREPYGVIGSVVPWNVPYLFAARKIAPALACGNVVILKPAEETPLSALRLAEVTLEAGLPDGVVQVVTGGREAGAALVADHRVDLISFTGHHETGKHIARAAADRLTPLILELGGKSPQIVFDDADLDDALENVLFGIFSMSGQMCYAGSRLLVQDSVYDAFVTRLTERVQNLRVGDPADGRTQIGPQVTRMQRDKTLALIRAGMSEGAIVAASAPVPDHGPLRNGFFSPPTLFVDADPGMRIMREEIFGPVLAATRFTDEEDALRIAHTTEFGLAAGVWTRDLARAHRMAAALNVGTVWLNSYRIVSDLVPFGGNGLSGYGRELGAEALTQLTRTKSVWTSTAPGLPPGYTF